MLGGCVAWAAIVAPRDHLTWLSAVLAVAAVAAGLGVAVLPSDATAEGTAALPLTDRGAHRVISLAWSARRTLTAPVAALRHHLITHGPAALGDTHPAPGGRPQ